MQRLFEPLGYRVSAEHHPLDEKFPEWGESPYYTVELAKNVTLQDLLTHLYVLIPVLDAKRRRRSGSVENEPGRIFSATSRPRRVSFAISSKLVSSWVRLKLSL